ncbi:MAG: S1/P1 Nuclease [Pseudomonadota bacterium]
MTLKAALLALLLAAPASVAFAWGADGHRDIGRAAMRALPAELPAFLKTAAAVWQVGELAREPDRSKGAGHPHDDDLDPNHFVDLSDDGSIAGGPSISAMPAHRAAYDAALRALGTDGYKQGYLFYSIVDGYQQLVKDFAYWRVDSVGATTEADPVKKAWYAKDKALREAIILRDLGYWSHFVGDASQPLHVTVHYNAWGDYPNPRNFTRDRIHAPFEGGFVHANVTEDMVLTGVAAPRPFTAGETIQARTAAFILASKAKVEPLFQLWTEGGFTGADVSRGRAFATACLASGAAELRDLVVEAWRASHDSTVGYPVVKVADIESGKVAVPYDALVGND